MATAGKPSTEFPETVTAENCTGTPTEGPPGAAELVVLFCVIILLMATGLFGNITAILTICLSKAKKLKLEQHGFIVSLSLADTLFLAVGFPMVIPAIVHGDWVLGDDACSFHGYVSVVCSHASIYNLALIAFNRYMSIVHIAAHRDIFTKRNSVAMMVAVWALALLLPVPAFAGWSKFVFLPYVDSCSYDWGGSFSFVLYINILGFLLPGLFIAYCYVRIFATVWRSKRKVKVAPNGAAATQQPKLKKEEVRLAVQLMIVFVFFVICWGPFMVLVSFVDADGSLDDTGIYDVTSNLIVLNSVVNPAIYFFFNKLLRQEAASLLTCGRWRAPGPNAHVSTLSSSAY